MISWILVTMCEALEGIVLQNWIKFRAQITDIASSKQKSLIFFNTTDPQMWTETIPYSKECPNFSGLWVILVIWLIIKVE